MLGGMAIEITVLGIALTMFAIGFGFASYYGYLGLQEKMHEAVKVAADKKLAEYFENESLKDKIRLMVGTDPPAADPVVAIPAAAPEHVYQEGGNVDANANNGGGEAV